MFEDMTYEAILGAALSAAPSDIDIRQGSIFRDSVTAQALILAQFYVDLENLRLLIDIDTATGDYLDLWASMFGLERQPATLARYAATYEGTPPLEGERFFVDEVYLGAYYDDDGTPYFESEALGTEGNVIPPGTPATPFGTVPGLQSATVGALLEAGADIESDDSLRERLRERVAGPAENGNKQHYKTWCEQVPGVGFARIIPLWKGPNTVKGIIFDDLGLPAGPEVIKRVQEYVDPDEDGDGEGEGLGEGVANLGAKFTAVAPGRITLDVSAEVQITPDVRIEDVKEQVTTLLTEYLRELVLENEQESSPMIRYNEIGARLLDADGVIDYKNLLVNGKVGNIQPEEDEVAVLGTVTVTTTEAVRR